MDIPVSLCLELLTAADYLALDGTFYPKSCIFFFQ